MGDDNKDTKPTLPRGYVLRDKSDVDAAGTCFFFCFLMCVGIIVYAFKYTQLDANSFFWLAPCFLAAGAIPIIVSALLRRSLRKGLRSLPMIILPVAMTIMMSGLFCGGHVVAALSNAEDAKAFVVSQYAGLADDKGVLHLATLERVRDEQNRLSGEAQDLMRLSNNVALLRETDAADKARLNADIQTASAAIARRQLLPGKQWKVSEVIEIAQYVGTPETTSGKPSYSVTADELNNEAAIIAVRYPHWAQLVNLFHRVFG